MYFYQTNEPTPKMTLRGKITLAVWIVISLCLLFFFAFTIFLVALVVGAVLFLIHLFQRAQARMSPRRSPAPYQRPRQKSDYYRDDDIIDV